MQGSAERISRLIYTSVVAGFALLVIAAAAVMGLIQRGQDLADLVEHTYRVESTLWQMPWLASGDA